MQRGVEWESGDKQKGKWKEIEKGWEMYTQHTHTHLSVLWPEVEGDATPELLCGSLDFIEGGKEEAEVLDKGLGPLSVWVPQRLVEIHLPPH